MSVPALQQGAFDKEDTLNCNNQGDVKRWLSKYIEDGNPPPAGTTFQLPDRKEADPPSTSDKRCVHIARGTHPASTDAAHAWQHVPLLAICAVGGGIQFEGTDVTAVRRVMRWCRLEVKVKSEPSLRPTRPPSARAAAVAPGGYAAVADGGVLNEVIEQEAREARCPTPSGRQDSHARQGRQWAGTRACQSDEGAHCFFCAAAGAAAPEHAGAACVQHACLCADTPRQLTRCKAGTEAGGRRRQRRAASPATAASSPTCRSDGPS